MIDKIKQRIKVMGITKQHLAKNAGMHPTQLSHVLKGRRELTDEQEFKIKKYLGI